MVLSTHGHTEIEANELMMLKEFKLRMWNLMWMLAFSFKWPLLHHDSFLRTCFGGALRLLWSSSLQSYCIYQLRYGNWLPVCSLCISLKWERLVYITLVGQFKLPWFGTEMDRYLCWYVYSKFWNFLSALQEYILIFSQFLLKGICM